MDIIGYVIPLKYMWIWWCAVRLFIYLFMAYINSRKTVARFALFAPRVSMTTIDAYGEKQQKKEKKNILRIIRHIYENKSRQTTASAEHFSTENRWDHFQLKPSLNHALPFVGFERRSARNGTASEMILISYKYEMVSVCRYVANRTFVLMLFQLSGIISSVRIWMWCACVFCFLLFLQCTTWNNGTEKKKLFVRCKVATANEWLPFLINHSPAAHQPASTVEWTMRQLTKWHKTIDRILTSMWRRENARQWNQIENISCDWSERWWKSILNVLYDIASPITHRQHSSSQCEWYCFTATYFHIVEQQQHKLRSRTVFRSLSQFSMGEEWRLKRHSKFIFFFQDF